MAAAFSVGVDCPDSVQPSANFDCRLNLVLDNNAETVNAFQFKVSLPSGFSGQTPLVTSTVMSWVSLENPAVVFSYPNPLPAGQFAVIHLRAGSTEGADGTPPKLALTDKVPDFASNEETITLTTACPSGQENIAGYCKDSAAVDGLASTIAGILANNQDYPTLLQKVSAIAKAFREFFR